MNQSKCDLPNNHDEKVDPVPPVSQICISVNNETHCDYFNRALKGEEHSEDDATLLNEVVDSRLVVAVVVVVHSEEERVQEDKEYDEVIEPAKLGELTRSSYLHSISHTVAFLSHICPRNKKSDRLSYCRLRLSSRTWVQVPPKTSEVFSLK